MAFPTSVGNFVTRGCGGPFLSSGGNVYIVGTAPGDLTKLSAYKATDPASSFSNIGTDFQMTSANSIDALAAYQVGDNLHVITTDSASATTNQIRYHIFSTSSDTWTTTNEAVKGTNFSIVNNTSARAIGISLRSNGDVIVSYQGPLVANMGADRDRVYYARRVSGTWTVDVIVDNGGATSWRAGNQVLGASDRTHFFFYDSGASDAYQRALTSANALETFPASFDATIQTGDESMVLRGASYDSVGTIKVRFPYFDSTSNTTNSAKCDSADAPTMSIDSGITGASLTNQSPRRASFSADGTTLWHAYVEAVSLDILTQSNANDAGWSAPASFYTGTVAAVYTNVYTRGADTVLAIVFDETGTKYHEKVLSSTPPATPQRYSVNVSQAVNRAGTF